MPEILRLQISYEQKSSSDRFLLLDPKNRIALNDIDRFTGEIANHSGSARITIVKIDAPIAKPIQDFDALLQSIKNLHTVLQLDIVGGSGPDKRLGIGAENFQELV